MIRASLHWTAEDRLTRAKWVRAVSIFYGCIVLIAFGFVLIHTYLIERRVEQIMGSHICNRLSYGAADRTATRQESAVKKAVSTPSDKREEAS